MSECRVSIPFYTLSNYSTLHRTQNTVVPEPEMVDGEEHYEVQEILDSRFFRNKLQYLVAWKGYNYQENSWANADDVHADEHVQEFYRQNPGAPCRIRQVHFAEIRFQKAREDTCP